MIGLDPLYESSVSPLLTACEFSFRMGFNFLPKQIQGQPDLHSSESEVGTATKLSTVGDIFRQRCHRRRVGNIFRYSIFRGFPKMHERCPVCDLKFDREPGYFLGAMYISYGLGIVIVAVIAGPVWFVTGRCI